MSNQDSLIAFMFNFQKNSIHSKSKMYSVKSKMYSVHTYIYSLLQFSLNEVRIF